MTPIEWNDSEPGFPDHLPPDARDLNVPELTGRRRYRKLGRYGMHDGYEILMLEVEEAVYTEVSRKRGWEIRWRSAKPSDVSEDVI
jgi:hypothetical protein